MNNGSAANNPDSAKPDSPQFPSACRPVQSHDDILPAYLGTPVEELLAYHNLGDPFKEHAKPKLLIGTCMDYRIAFRMPKDFAYVIRTGGANLRGLEFHVSVAVSGGVQTVCLIGHDQCAMGAIADRKDAFVSGLVEQAEWGEREALAHYEADSPRCAIGNEIEFVRSETVRLSKYYPSILVAPLFYSVQERVLYQVDLA